MLILLLAAAGGGIWLRCEGTAPTIEAPEALLIGRDGISLVLRVSDPESGVREVAIRLRHEKGEQVLFERAYAGNPFTGGVAKPDADPIEIAIDPKSLGMGDGEAILEVNATDWSWAETFAGNSRVLEIPIRVDLEPPRIWVESGLTYVQRGGAAAVVYSLDEPTSRDGVEVGDTFFSGFPFPGEETGQAQETPAGGRRFAIFAVPRDAPANAAIRAVAVDEAGNRTAVSWLTRLQEREFPEVRINLGGAFLSSKVPELASSLGVEEDDPISAFQRINSETRAANELRIREIVASGSAGTSLAWRLPAAAQLGGHQPLRRAPLLLRGREEDLGGDPLRLRPGLHRRRADHRSQRGAGDLRGRARDLRELRHRRSRSRRHQPLRPSLANRRPRGRPAEEGPEAGALGCHRARRRRSPALRRPGGRHLRGSQGVVGSEVGARAHRGAPRDPGSVKISVAADLEGRLLRRYKRFFADIETREGEKLTVHCPNPGSMRGLVREGAAVRCSSSDNPKRKLRHTLEMIRVGRTWVGLHTGRANALAEAALRADGIEAFSGYGRMRREVVTPQGSRIDFLLEEHPEDPRPAWIEVKSVTMAEGNLARFPDSVTERGRKHAMVLANLVDERRSLGAALRGAARGLRPDRAADDIDPAYGAALREAASRGVEVLAVGARVTARSIRVEGALPVLL